MAKRRPPTTPEAMEMENILLASELANQKLRDGTASSQIISELLKPGTKKERLIVKKLEAEVKLLEARTTAIQSAETMEKIATEAISAMKKYQGVS